EPPRRKALTVNDQDKRRAALAQASSLDFLQDADTFTGVAREAGAAMAAAAGAGDENAMNEAHAMFTSATMEASIYARLAVVAAVRELTGVLDDLRRMQP